jgi:quercetin dioxygenase-like cupin family protein
MSIQGFLTGPTADNTRAIPGGLFHFLATGEQTAHSLALMQVLVYPGAEPPLHVHAGEDESYYVLEGQVKYFIGEQVLLAQAGQFVYMPKGVPHRFEIQPPFARFLMVITPAGLGKWFWDHSVPAPDNQPLPLPQGPPAAEQVAEFVQSLGEYGVVMVEQPDNIHR